MAKQSRDWSTTSSAARRVQRRGSRRAPRASAAHSHSLRETRHLTQTQLAETLQVTLSNVSRIERRQDLYLSTLAEYVAVLGGSLRVAAVFEDDEVEIGAGGSALTGS
jgi:DNA-binding XRE family transcriptional regulator